MNEMLREINGQLLFKTVTLSDESLTMRQGCFVYLTLLNLHSPNSPYNYRNYPYL